MMAYLFRYTDHPPEMMNRGWHLIPLIARLPSDDTQWISAGLGGKTDRERANALLKQLYATRSWIVPYPIDGIKALLRQGLTQAKEDNDRAWYTLQLAKILLLEQADDETIREVLGNLPVDEQGKPMVERA